MVIGPDPSRHRMILRAGHFPLLTQQGSGKTPGDHMPPGALRSVQYIGVRHTVRAQRVLQMREDDVLPDDLRKSVHVLQYSAGGRFFPCHLKSGALPPGTVLVVFSRQCAARDGSRGFLPPLYHQNRPRWFPWWFLPCDFCTARTVPSGFPGSS